MYDWFWSLKGKNKKLNDENDYLRTEIVKLHNSLKATETVITPSANVIRGPNVNNL